MADRKTPGVYVVEENAFPNSIVEVATAIPAFIGCTQSAARGSKQLIGVPTKITSMDDYSALFGGAPVSAKTVNYAQAAKPGASPTVSMIEATQFYFYASMRLFFDNGGGTCYVVSVGLFDDVVTNGGMASINFDDKCTAALKALEKELDVTMIVVPDAVRAGLDSWQKICQGVLQHCVQMQSRIGIFDIVNGNLPRTLDDADIISGTNGFRARISGDGDNLNYATAYYPWLDTSINEASDVTFAWLSDDAKSLLITDLTADAKANVSNVGKLADLTTIIQSIGTPLEPQKARQAHLVLNMQSLLYQQVMGDILELSNVVPPSGAMAGVYARVDDESGVFWAPANVTINSVVKPTVSISDAEQEDLNVPLDGKAINAIRVIPNRDLVVWGARTLDGNSEDWRYINVRRTIIMLEQSIKNAAMAFVFHPNQSVTWVSIKSMITNFLTARWKEGALAGTKAEDAFSVDIGLGFTMTATEILDGYMNISVNVALSHPAEFIVLTFKQQLQKS
jgi:phage tail sheath protein FI